MLKFRAPVNTEEVDDYLDYVSNPMDFEKMHIKLDDGKWPATQRIAWADAEARVVDGASSSRTHRPELPAPSQSGS